jgi:threonine synthase
MTMAMTAAVEAGAQAVVCASTGNTSASAAAYATAAGLKCAVLVPEGKISMGKLSQAVAHGATLLQVDGNFDNCLDIARKLGESYPVFLVNSVNPARIQGQKTGAFEVVDALGDAPDIHVLPVGNAGNISAYWKGYKEYAAPYETANGTLAAVSTKTPIMWGFQAAGAAPFVAGHPITDPDTIATAIRIGNPASWDTAVAARDESGGLIDAVTDEEILAAHRWLSSKEGVFVEPGSAAGVAGLIKKHAAGDVPSGKTIVITVTGHGLKDPQWALRTEDGSEVQPVKVPNDVVTVAAELGLEEK